jgi:DNA-binding transcriptional ArsR family regulator
MLAQADETGEQGASLQRAAELFALLSTVPRLRILSALCQREMCVSELTQSLALPQPAISQQLNLLYRAGLLARRKQGAQVYYKPGPEAGAFICGALRSVLR